MIKNIKGLLFGLLIGILVIGTIEALGHFIYPNPKDFDFENKQLLQNHINNLPFPAFLFIVLAHGLGTFIGSFIANKTANSIGPIGLIVSALFLILTITNLLIIPFHPIWFVVTDILITFICGWAAFKIALKKKK